MIAPLPPERVRALMAEEARKYAERNPVPEPRVASQPKPTRKAKPKAPAHPKRTWAVSEPGTRVMTSAIFKRVDAMRKAGYTWPSIGEAIGWNQNTVKKRYYKALK